jgi:hypothetical protein
MFGEKRLKYILIFAENTLQNIPTGIKLNCRKQQKSNLGKY